MFPHLIIYSKYPPLQNMCEIGKQSQVELFKFSCFELLKNLCCLCVNLSVTFCHMFSTGKGGGLTIMTFCVVVTEVSLA